MQQVLVSEIPGWLISLVMVAESAVMVYVHRRMSWPIKLSMSIPVWGLAFVLVVFWLHPSDVELQRFFGRAFLFWIFFWRSILLWVTRKQHNV